MRREERPLFYISLPRTVKIGDTADVKINGEPKKLTYLDAKTLVIEPGDARTIVFVRPAGDLNDFICGDAAA